LLDFSGPTRFDAIRAPHIVPAVDELLPAARSAVDSVASIAATPTWDNVAAPLADALDPLERAWAAIHHMNAVASTPAIRDAYHASLPKVTAFHTDLAQDERLYARCKALAASPAFAALDSARRKLIENEIRDFRLGGADLPPAQQARLKAVDEELAELSAQFDDHVLDSTNAYGLYVDDVGRLAGVPKDVVAAALAAAQDEERDGWKLTLRCPASPL
jgi:oligopeptidase A